MDKQETDEIDVFVAVWVSSPSLHEFQEQLRTTFDRMQPSQDEPMSGSELRIMKFNEYIINIVLKHFINDAPTDIVNILKESFENEYDILSRIANEIKQAIEDVSFDIPFECVMVDILNEDLSVAKIRYLT